MYDKLKAALRMGSDWLGELAHQYSEYFGGVGTSEFVEELLQCMSVAFDWQYLFAREWAIPKRTQGSLLKAAQSIEARSTALFVARPTDLPTCGAALVRQGAEENWGAALPVNSEAQGRVRKATRLEQSCWLECGSGCEASCHRACGCVGSCAACEFGEPDLDFYTRRVAVLLCPRSFFVSLGLLQLLVEHESWQQHSGAGLGALGRSRETKSWKLLVVSSESWFA